MFRRTPEGPWEYWLAHRCALVSSPNQSQKLSAPFPLHHVHWIAQRRCCLLPAGCLGYSEFLPLKFALSCCDRTIPDVSDLLAAPGGPSQHPLMTSPLTFPATSSTTYLGSSLPSTTLPNRPAGTALQCLLFIGQYSLIPKMRLSLMNSK